MAGGVLLWCQLTSPVLAASATVVLLETDEEVCMAHGGKLVSLHWQGDASTESIHGNTSTETIKAIEVWVDRWFMQVQTADHTRHVLSASIADIELGCSHSLAGPQHWTIASMRTL